MAEPRIKGMSGSRATVLIGFAEALSAPEAAWSLVDAGHHVIAFARRGRPSALRHSRFVKIQEICAPESDLQTSLIELQSLLTSVEKEASSSPLVLLPLDDKAVWLASRVQLNQLWSLAGPRGPQAELALNKCLQVQAAHNAGFHVPASKLARTASDIFDFASEQSYPIILKPSECVPVRNGKLRKCKKWTCADRGELDRAVGAWRESVPLLVQSFVGGIGAGIFALATPDGLRAWSGHRRVRMMNPQGSGSSACISQAVPEDLRAHAEELIRQIGWTGAFMIELLRDHAGRVWFVEFNGRPWGSMALCRRQGLEYPAWQVELALDPNSQAGNGARGTEHLLCRHAGREFMHLLFVLRGPRSKAFIGWPSFWNALREVGTVRPGDTVYNWRRDDPMVFAGDFWQTVRDNVFKTKY
jgi:predicted ATP-grasp superfamily ATP-dependent carboligase